MYNSFQVGSFDAGYGSTHMARLVGQKKAREMWFLARLYDAREALDMGLVNTVRGGGGGGGKGGGVAIHGNGVYQGWKCRAERGGGVGRVGRCGGEGRPWFQIRAG